MQEVAGMTLLAKRGFAVRSWLQNLRRGSGLWIFVSCRGGGCSYSHCACATKRVDGAALTTFEKFRPKGAGSVISGE